jgi:hypothetical protein
MRGPEVVGERSSRVLRGVLASSAALALSLAPAIAAADEPGDGPEPPPAVAVHIGSVRPGTSVAIEATGEQDDEGAVGRVVSRCFDDCEEVLDPGPYRLRLVGADGVTLGTRSVNVRRPMAVHVLDTSPGAATSGLVLGISGTVILLTGVAALGGLALQSSCEANNCDNNKWLGVYALASIPAGIVMTVVGWRLFAHNHSTFGVETIKERKGHEEHDSALNLRLGIATGPQGVSGGLTLSF